MNRLKHDLTDLLNSLELMQGIINGDEKQLIEMKVVLSEEITRLIKTIDHIKAEVK